MIRILHFADVHLGMEAYGQWDPETGLSMRLMDFLAAFDRLVERAITEEVDVVIFAGDAYRTRDPTPTHQREFATRIRRLAQADIPVVLVAGNHDTPQAAGRANAIEIFDTLRVDKVKVPQRPEILNISTRHGELQVVVLPWIVRSTILAREEYRGASAEEINALIADRVTNIITNPQNGFVSRLNPSLPTVLAAHATAQGAVYGSERSVMLGQEVVLPPGLVTHPAFDYVALGHIHRHQVLSEHPPVIYSGSIERVDFGEEGEEKGFILAEIERGSAKWEFVPLPTRPFVTVEVEADGPDPTGRVTTAIQARHIENAIVRLIVHTTSEWEPLLRDDDIRRALEPAFYVSALIRDVQRPTRLRLGSHAAAELGPEELLRYYLETKGTTPERTEVLIEHAQEILRGATDA